MRNKRIPSAKFQWILSFRDGRWRWSRERRRPARSTSIMKRSLSIVSLILSLGLLAACLSEEEQEQDRAINAAILGDVLTAEQAGGSAEVAFRNEYNPGSCPAWYVNVNDDGSTKATISSTDTNQTSGTITVPAPEIYDLDIRCSNDGANVNYQAQSVENGRQYLLHYKSDGNISFAETAL